MPRKTGACVDVHTSSFVRARHLHLQDWEIDIRKAGPANYSAVMDKINVTE